MYSGIGLACAHSFAAEHATLILLGRRKERLDSLKATLLSHDPTLLIHTVPMFVTDYDAVAALPLSLPAPFSSVSILINNAGLALGVTTVDKNSVVDAQSVLDTNVMGTISMCTAFLPGMLARGEGHVVNMGSVAGHYAYTTGSGNYTVCIHLPTYLPTYPPTNLP